MVQVSKSIRTRVSGERDGAVVSPSVKWGLILSFLLAPIEILLIYVGAMPIWSGISVLAGATYAVILSVRSDRHSVLSGILTATLSYIIITTISIPVLGGIYLINMNMSVATVLFGAFAISAIYASVIFAGILTGILGGFIGISLSKIFG